MYPIPLEYELWGALYFSPRVGSGQSGKYLSVFCVDNSWTPPRFRESKGWRFIGLSEESGGVWKGGQPTVQKVGDRRVHVGRASRIGVNRRCRRMILDRAAVRGRNCGPCRSDRARPNPGGSNSE